MTHKDMAHTDADESRDVAVEKLGLRGLEGGVDLSRMGASTAHETCQKLALPPVPPEKEVLWQSRMVPVMLRTMPHCE